MMVCYNGDETTDVYQCLFKGVCKRDIFQMSRHTTRNGLCMVYLMIINTTIYGVQDDATTM